MRFPSTLASIGEGAFTSCTGVTDFEVDRLNAVYTSDDGVLFSRDREILIRYPCGRKGAFEIPESVVHIGTRAFDGCDGLSEVIMGGGVTSIGAMAFLNCINLVGMTIDAQVEFLGAGVFSRCFKLKNITIPNSVTTINGGAFSRCTSLDRIVVPDSVTNLGGGTFSDCTNLKEAVLGSGIVAVPGSVFRYCTSLTNVVIPDSVTRIESHAFLHCSSLASIAIPDQVTIIENWAFKDCRSLATIDIPERVGTVEYFAFSGCHQLTAINVHESNRSYSSMDGVLFDKSRRTLVSYPAGKGGDYTVPDTVTRIDRPGFLDATKLDRLWIPDSVNQFSDEALSGCAGLTRVSIGSGLHNLGSRVFDECINLATIDVDASNPNLKSLDGVLMNKVGDTLLRYPIGRAGFYVVPNTVSAIANRAFLNCDELTGIILPESVKRIGDWAFTGCVALTRINIPHGVTHIGERTFAFCEQLERVVVPRSVSTIGEQVFDQCSKPSGVYFAGAPPIIEYRGSESLGGGSVVFYQPNSGDWNSRYGRRPTAVWRVEPEYADWVATTKLAADFPDASGEADDPDADGMQNRVEMLTGTDPTDWTSALVMESRPRLNDLIERHKGPVSANRRALYVRSIPDKTYALQVSDTPDGPWAAESVITASATQIRFVVDNPQPNAFYRVQLAQ